MSLFKKKDKQILVTIDDLSRHDLVKIFNKRLRWLMDAIYKVSGRSVKIDSLKNQLFIAVSENFEMAMLHAGPEIHSFQEAIRSNNLEFFCNMKIDVIPQAITDKYDSSIILMLQKEMPNFKEQKIRKIFTCVNMLLDGYLEFVLFEKFKNKQVTEQNMQDYGFRYITQTEYKKIQDDLKKERLERKKLKKEAKKNKQDNESDSSGDGSLFE